jgi:hypothetical protein
MTSNVHIHRATAAEWLPAPACFVGYFPGVGP